MEIAKSIDSLTTVETFLYWQNFCVLSGNSTSLNCHFEIIELYRHVLTSFPFLLFLSRRSDKVPFRVTSHKYLPKDNGLGQVIWIE